MEEFQFEEEKEKGRVRGVRIRAVAMVTGAVMVIVAAVSAFGL